MQQIYSLIQENPDFYAWVFGLVNVLWAAFLYFNKKTHDSSLQKGQHSHDLGLERRKKVFELKLAQFEKYLGMLDEFGRKHQTQLADRMQPVFAKYLESMMAAQDDAARGAAIGLFTDSIMELMSESSSDYIKLKAESRSLRLVASDDLLACLDGLEIAAKNSMDSANEFIQKLPSLVMTGNQLEIDAAQPMFESQAEEITRKSKAMETQMRVELANI